MNKIKKLQDKFRSWVWGENNILPERPNYLINLEYAVSIRFDYELAMFASYEEFCDNIADVQFYTNRRPSEEEVERIIEEAWNFLAIEERILEEDLEDIDYDDVL